MKKFQLPTEEVIEKFQQILELFPDARTRKMFGYPCGFLNDKMFCCIFEDELVLRLPEVEKKVFIEKYDAKPFAPKGGNGMREYAIVPKEIANDLEKLNIWVEKSAIFVLELPEEK